jgi:hypothetical protein
MNVNSEWIGDTSDCNLLNKEGFPAVQFRTDTRGTITKNDKYKLKEITKSIII